MANSDILRRLWHDRAEMAAQLERYEAIGRRSHRALTSCWRMIFSENRYPLFGIMR
jgi:hypothetical protein